MVVWSGWWTINRFTWNMVGDHHFYLSTQKTGCLKFQDDLNSCKTLPNIHESPWGCFLFRWMRQTCYPWWKHDWIFCFWLIHDTGPFIAAKGIMWIPFAQIIVNFIIFHPKISISPEIRATPILLAKDSARTNKYRPQVRSWFFAFEILKKNLVCKHPSCANCVIFRCFDHCSWEIFHDSLCGH